MFGFLSLASENSMKSLNFSDTSGNRAPGNHCPGNCVLRITPQGTKTQGTTFRRITKELLSAAPLMEKLFLLLAFAFLVSGFAALSLRVRGALVGLVGFGVGLGLGRVDLVAGVVHDLELEGAAG